ncbi:MAG: DNA polymerase/3'-5' exonuclease PolX, partial [Armatimonadetes bacterium]|nr:DNA polymerase/3'-5' exonuclease PolX [Armatimonadota bacterium]
MNNAAIAQVFSEIAVLLEIKGENTFKIRAYERAAEAIANLSQDLAQVRAEQDGLRSLPSVGAAIAEKIEELLDTGKCSYHQDLLQEIPITVFDILRIPGIGPKKVKVLMEDASIVTLEQLEEAARAGQLRELPGMGKKTEQDILSGIEHVRQYAKRTELGLASEIAANVMRQLREDAPVEQIEVAGSLRRGVETIGDIDLLVTSRDPEAVMETFVKLPLAAETVVRGPTKSTIRSAAGIQIDLRVVAPESFGAALQYFTGSKQHNVRLRELAVRQGLKLNEYGVFGTKGGVEKRLGGETEAEIYAALGLPIMPPEMREDRGEIEAAREGPLPTLIEQGDLAGDLHVHSNWSDGHNTVAEMVRAAQDAGYSYVALTDHSPSQTVANGLSVKRLKERRAEIEAARDTFPDMTILEGAEVDIKRDGTLDYPDDVLGQLDFVIASVHSGWKMDEAAMTARIIRALENPWVDCLGHPTGRLVGQREPYPVDLDAVFRAAAELGVAMEISS